MKQNFGIYQKIIATIISLLVIIVLFLVAMYFLGYKFNKDYFKKFDREACIQKELPTYAGHSGIEGCIFWMRNDYLERTQEWRSGFKEDTPYCNIKYPEYPTSISTTFGRLSDPKCSYSAFADQKRNENWSYLTSKKRDGYYDYCVSQICPKPVLFK